MGLLEITYGFLTALCIWAAWRDPDWRSIGVAIALSYGVSNFAVRCVAIDARPAIYTCTEIIIALMAFMAANNHRSARCGTLLMIVSFISIYCNIHLAASEQHWVDIHAHEIRTNVAFTVECLIVIFTGARERDLFNHWVVGRRHVDTNNVVTEKAREQ